MTPVHGSVHLLMPLGGLRERRASDEDLSVAPSERRASSLSATVGPERLSPWRRREMLAVMHALANVPSLIAQLMSKLEICR